MEEEKKRKEDKKRKEKERLIKRKTKAEEEGRVRCASKGYTPSYLPICLKDIECIASDRLLPLFLTAKIFP